MAVDDGPFQALGNVQITRAAPGVLGNDTLNGGSISALNGVGGSPPLVGTTAQGGNVTLRADGSFDFNPRAGFQGSDSFTYTVTNSSGNSTATVSLSVSGMIWFVDNSQSANGDGRLTSPFNCLVGTGCFSSSASAAGDNVFLYRQTPASYTGGVTLLNAQKLIGQGASASLSTLSGLTPPSGSLALPSTGGTNPIVVTTAPSTNAINLGSGNTLDGFSIGNHTGVGISGSGFGLLTVNDMSINGAGQALGLVNGSLSATFADVTSSSGTNNVSLTSVGGSLTMSSGAWSGSTGPGLFVSGGSGSIAYDGSISTTSVSGAVTVQGRTAGSSIVLNGNIASSGPLVIQSNTGGTASFGGSNKSLSTGAAAGVSLVNNGGYSVSFVNGGLSVTTTSGTAFNATGGGSVTVSGPGNTLSTTTGVALSVASTTIGSAGLTFQSIAVGSGGSGPSSGIVLNTTGSSGGLTVTGTGGAASGGTIQHTSGVGVSLTNTSNVSLTSMAIANTTGSGISGTQVINFSFVNGSIDSSNQSPVVGDGSNIAFGQPSAGSTESNISGTLTITGNTLTNAFVDGVLVHNFAGTLSGVNISNNTITSGTTASVSTGSGIQLIANGSATTVANVTQATINNNTIRNFPSGEAIQAQGGNGNVSGPGGTFGIPNTGDTITISGNTIGQGATVPFGAAGIDTNVQGANIASRSQGNFSITNNGSSGSPVVNVHGNALQNTAFDFATSTVTISNNVLAPTNVNGAQGIGGGIGTLLNIANVTPDMTATITNNTISQTNGYGILFVARGPGVNGTLRTKIQSNTVAAPLGTNRQGIRLDSGNGTAAENVTVCLNISSNTSAGSGTALGIGVHKQGTNAAIDTFGISGISPSTPTNAQVIAFINGQNPASSGTDIISGDNFVSCSFP
jgi:hypothetical protein